MEIKELSSKLCRKLINLDRADWNNSDGLYQAPQSSLVASVYAAGGRYQGWKIKDKNIKSLLLNPKNLYSFSSYCVLDRGVTFFFDKEPELITKNTNDIAGSSVAFLIDKKYIKQLKPGHCLLIAITND